MPWVTASVLRFDDEPELQACKLSLSISASRALSVSLLGFALQSDGLASVPPGGRS